MSRRLPSFAQDNYYHIYNRGAHQKTLFREHSDYLYVIRKLKRYARQFDVSIIAYCLMPNHYHMLVQQMGEQRAGLVPQYTFNGYSKAYNRRYRHFGTLFEGPYRAKHVENEVHLLHLCRYIHANPVKSGIASELAHWPYSNFREWVGIRHGALFDPQFIDAHFEDRHGYQEFIGEYLEVANWRNDFDFD